MSVAQQVVSTHADNAQCITGCGLDDVPVHLIGSAEGVRLEVEKQANGIRVTLLESNGADVAIKPVALFENDRGYHDMTTVMGSLAFSDHRPHIQSYSPFTRDAHRTLRAVYLPVQTLHDNAWRASTQPWDIAERLTRDLLQECSVAWHGLERKTARLLHRHVESEQPIEYCVLHALAQWTHARGSCVIEVGSFRESSAAVIALALEGAGSPIPIISVDPHADEPIHHEITEHMLRKLGQAHRLVQMPVRSDIAADVLRPGCASLVFVDGDDARKQVIADFQNYHELLAPGGCMLFHDYGFGAHTGQPEAHPGVRPAVDDHVFTHGDYEPLLSAHTMMAFVKRGQ